VMGDDAPKALGLWPVLALAGCLVAAGLTYRVDGPTSVAGALLAMSVGLASFPAAMFAWDRTDGNPGLGLDGPGEYVPWLLGLGFAGVLGAVAARVLGAAWAIVLGAVVLVLAELIGPAAGETHQLAIRCAGAAAIGIVIGGLRPEPAIAGFGLGAACGPVWPELQAAVADYDWLETLTEKPGGVPLPLLVLAGVAVLLAIVGSFPGNRPPVVPRPWDTPTSGPAPAGPWAPNAYPQPGPGVPPQAPPPGADPYPRPRQGLPPDLGPGPSRRDLRGPGA